MAHPIRGAEVSRPQTRTGHPVPPEASRTIQDLDMPANDSTVFPEIKAALRAERPVVALESTVITHGLPYPQNLELARDMESAVREEGAIPATIAVLDGIIRI